jgi:hypothetical protein
MKKIMRFTSVVLDGHKGLAFEVPFNPATHWGLALASLWPGRRGYRVRATVNKARFESVVVRRARRFLVLVTDEMREAGRLRACASVKLSLAPVL